uniref:Uncharacterized protein n=1 Tax=Rhizophora mucronata TaxID=61149 RepID=A0A2P2MUG5_RHIMU
MATFNWIKFCSTFMTAYNCNRANNQCVSVTKPVTRSTVGKPEISWDGV